MKNLALANLFYYQNPMTQQPSSHVISAQQICRVLCPAAAAASSASVSGIGSSSSTNANANANTNATSTTTTTTSMKSFLHSTSMVLAYDPSSQTFDPDGWKAIQDVPILKEASSLWYYNNHNNDQITMKQQQQQQQQQQVADTHHVHATSHNGPISCRELAVLYYNHQQQQQQQQQHKMVVTDDTRVWSPSPTFQHRDWMRIAELPDLITAMEAFEDCIHVCVDDMLDPKIVMERNENNNNVDKSGSRQQTQQQQQQQQQKQQNNNNHESSLPICTVASIHDDNHNNNKKKNSNTSSGTTWIFNDGSQVTVKSHVTAELNHGENHSSSLISGKIVEDTGGDCDYQDFFDQFESATQGENFKHPSTIMDHETSNIDPSSTKDKGEGIDSSSQKNATTDDLNAFMDQFEMETSGENFLNRV